MGGWGEIKPRQAIDDTIIRRTCRACWVPNATDAQNMYYLLLLHDNNEYANVPKCYVYT